MRGSLAENGWAGKLRGQTARYRRHFRQGAAIRLATARPAVIIPATTTLSGSGPCEAGRSRSRCGHCGGGRLPGEGRAFINILTGGTSGVYYPLGVALSQIYTDNVEGARPSVQATKASVENLNLLQAGKGEIAFTLGDSLALAVAGDADAGFPAPLDKLRASRRSIRTTSRSSRAQSSGIKTLADLKGKRLSVGAPKSGTELNARAILGRRG